MNNITEIQFFGCTSVYGDINCVDVCVIATGDDSGTKEDVILISWVGNEYGNDDCMFIG